MQGLGLLRTQATLGGAVVGDEAHAGAGLDQVGWRGLPVSHCHHIAVLVARHTWTGNLKHWKEAAASNCSHRATHPK